MPRPILCDPTVPPYCPPVPAIQVQVGDVIQLPDGTKYFIGDDDDKQGDNEEDTAS